MLHACVGMHVLRRKHAHASVEHGTLYDTGPENSPETGTRTIMAYWVIAGNILGMANPPGARSVSQRPDANYLFPHNRTCPGFASVFPPSIPYSRLRPLRVGIAIWVVGARGPSDTIATDRKIHAIRCRDVCDAPVFK